MSYYDIDAILTDAQVCVCAGRNSTTNAQANQSPLDIQKLPCKFELEVPGLGFLEGNPGENVRYSDKSKQTMTNSNGGHRSRQEHR